MAAQATTLLILKHAGQIWYAKEAGAGRYHAFYEQPTHPGIPASFLPGRRVWSVRD